MRKLSAPDDESAAGPLPNRALGINEHSDPIFIAAEAGFKQGVLVFEKLGGKGGDRVYTIESIGEITALKQTCPYNDQVININVHTVSQLLKDWGIVSATERPFKLAGGELRCTSAIQMDSMKATLYHAIVEASGEATHGLQFYRKPDCIITGEKFAKGSIVLAPLAPLANILTKKTAATFSLWFFSENEYLVMPPQRIPIKDTLEKFTAENSLAAFWWIISDTTDEDEEANMEVVAKRFGGKMINVLQNTKLVQKYTRLRVKKEERQEKRPLSNVISKVAQSREGAPQVKKRR